MSSNSYDDRHESKIYGALEIFCNRNIKCAFNKVWAYFDITKDGHLSLSEIARFQRNIIKFIAVRQEENVLKTEEVNEIRVNLDANDHSHFVVDMEKIQKIIFVQK